ncbi:MAG: PilZ domain-containing protein [Okeania sp. SIO1H5]|nr:PilZ domain-containing protein [Okeania sp. SIO1H5]
MTLTSHSNGEINELPATVVWQVNEPGLQGIGVAFSVSSDEQKHRILVWYNSLRTFAPSE